MTTKELIESFNLYGKISEQHAKDIEEILDNFVLEEKEQFEILLAEVIGDLYLEHKKEFCDYKNKTHKLGWFKEKIKLEINRKL